MTRWYGKGVMLMGVLALLGSAVFPELAQGKGVIKKPGAAAEVLVVDSDPAGQPLVTLVELGTVAIPTYGLMRPIIEELKREYGAQVQFEFHDVRTEAGKPFGVKYDILAYPMQIFLDKNGKEYFRHLGFFSKAEIVKVLKRKGVK